MQQLQSTLRLRGLPLARDLHLQTWSRHGPREMSLRHLHMGGPHSTPLQALLHPAHHPWCIQQVVSPTCHLQTSQFWRINICPDVCRQIISEIATASFATCLSISHTLACC